MSSKPLVEECLALDLARIMRLGPIRNGQSATGEYCWSIDGASIARLRFRLDLRTSEAGRLTLIYCPAGGDGLASPVRQVISMTALSQHFGGHRWWIVCPVTGHRTRTLLLPPCGDRFASRKAWGLAYRVERLTRFDRPFEKLFRVQRRLGSVQGLGAGLERPKGMWRRTFARHMANLDRHDLACAEQISALINKP